MAKKIAGYIKLQIPAGKANPSPPVGPALGQRGLNIMEFCKAFNAQTKGVEPGLPIPVVITAFADKSFTFADLVAVGAGVSALLASQRTDIDAVAMVFHAETVPSAADRAMTIDSPALLLSAGGGVHAEDARALHLAWRGPIVHRRLEKAIETGLVEGAPNSDNRRETPLRLTKKGRALYERLAPVVLDYERRLLAHLSPDELQGLLRALDKLEQGLGLVQDPDECF